MTRSLTRSAWLAAVALWVAAGCLQAAETNKSLRGHRTEAAPRIDGVLDESAWAEADTAVGFSNFDQPDVMAGDQTIGRVLFDDEAIYVGLECLTWRASRLRRDNPPSPGRRSGRRDLANRPWRANLQCHAEGRGDDKTQPSDPSLPA